MTKQFHISDLLSITTDRVLSSRHMGGVYDILRHMTGDSVFTHQIPRAERECRPWLLRWFPELAPASASMKELDDWLAASPTCPSEGVKMWLTQLRMMFPSIKEHYDVPQIPADDHELKDPWDELVEMRGTDEGVIPVVIPDRDQQ